MDINDFSLRKCFVLCYDLEVITYSKNQDYFSCNKFEVIEKNTTALKVSYFVEMKKQVYGESNCRVRGGLTMLRYQQ